MNLYSLKNFLLFIAGFLAILSFLAVSPALSTEADMDMNAGQLRFHDGNVWKNTYNLGAGGACTPDQTRYNATRYTFQFCNGSSVWRDATKPIIEYTCNNSTFNTTGNYCRDTDDCFAYVNHGVERCCESAPSNTYCRGQYRQYTCQSNGNWSGPSGYYTSASGNCSSSGTYSGSGSVRCASTPHPDGCDPAPTGTSLTCTENLDGTCSGDLAINGSCGTPLSCGTLSAPETRCCSGPAMCSDSCGVACFVAGTPIKMADGTYKNVEDVAKGDMVLTSSGPQAADKIFVKDHKSKIYGFNGGEPFFTPNHPFMTLEGWKAVDPDAAMEENKSLNLHVELLEVGDTLLMEDGSQVVIESFTEKAFEGKVYNFETPVSHDYYANGYWVHNAIKFE